MNKKGLVDDFADLLSLVLILSMVSFFAVIVLRTDVNDKTDQTLARIEYVQGQQELLDLVNAPVLVNDREVTMKDLIISTVNTADTITFEEKMGKYFTDHNLKGAIAVYDSVSYETKEEPEPLFSYNNGFFSGEEKGALYLTNTYARGKAKSVVVKLFG